jgi:hypothetical protein
MFQEGRKEFSDHPRIKKEDEQDNEIVPYHVT